MTARKIIAPILPALHIYFKYKLFASLLTSIIPQFHFAGPNSAKMDHHHRSSAEFANDTALVGDPLAEIDAEIEHEFNHYNIIWTIQIVFMFAKVIVCLISVAADMFLAVTILRFKRLQTRINTYILHMCIITSLLYFIIPMFVTILDLIIHHFAIYYMMEVQNTFLMSYVTFSLILAVDWIVSNYNSPWIAWYHRYYKYCIPVIYFMFFIYTLVTVFSDGMTMTLMKIFLYYYIASAVILIALNIVKRFTRVKPETQKTAYAMTVSNIAIFSFLPTFFIYWLLTYLLPHNFTIDMIFVFIESIVVMLSLSHPIIIVYYLGKENKYFKMAYNKSFKRSIRSYGDDNLDEVSEDENPDINKVVVNYSNDDGLDENKQVLII